MIDQEFRSAAELVRDPEYMRKLAEAMNNLTAADIAAVCEDVVSRSPGPTRPAIAEVTPTPQPDTPQGSDR